MFLFVGLGNPGSEYASNRHNIGFMAADVIHRRHHFSLCRKQFKGDFSEGTLGGDNDLLLKPPPLMTERGRSLREPISFTHLWLENVYVFYD